MIGEFNSAMRGAARALALSLLAGLLLAPMLPAPAQADLASAGRLKCYKEIDRDHTDWGAYGVEATVKQVGRLCYTGRRKNWNRYVADATVLRMRIIGQGQCAFSTVTQGWLRHIEWQELYMGNRESGEIVHLPTANKRSKCKEAARQNNASIKIIRWKNKAPMYMRTVRFDDSAVDWWMGAAPICLHYRDNICGENDRLSVRNLKGRLGPNE